MFLAHAGSSSGADPHPGKLIPGLESREGTQLVSALPGQRGCPRRGRELSSLFIPALLRSKRKTLLPSAARNNPGLQQPKSFQGGILKCWEFGLSACASGCRNVPGRERQTLNIALLLISRNQRLNREQFTPRSPQDPLGSCFHPSLFQHRHHHHRHSSCLERTLVMDSISPVGCASGAVMPQHPSRALHFAALLPQDAPEMSPPCSDSPAAGEARIWVSVRGT